MAALLLNDRLTGCWKSPLRGGRNREHNGIQRSPERNPTAAEM